jgi:predicted nucleotidyltransferase
MAEKLLVDIEGSVRELCAERDIPVDSVRFFGSHAAGEANAGSDVDLVLVSPAFEGKDIFQRAGMTKGIHRALVKRFRLPFDIVFCSVSDWRHGRSPLLEEVKRGVG